MMLINDGIFFEYRIEAYFKTGVFANEKNNKKRNNPNIYFCFWNDFLYYLLSFVINTYFCS